MLFLMNERIKELTEQASLLPPIERAELVEGILQSLDATDPHVDQLWAEEAKDRLAAYRGQDTKVHFMPLSRERMGNLSGQN